MNFEKTPLKLPSQSVRFCMNFVELALIKSMLAKQWILAPLKLIKKGASVGNNLPERVL